jgi:hypothetical protein
MNTMKTSKVSSQKSEVSSFMFPCVLHHLICLRDRAALGVTAIVPFKQGHDNVGPLRSDAFAG